MEKSLCVGYFWDVYGQLYVDCAPFDDKAKSINDGEAIRINKSREDSWELVKTKYKLPNKPVDHYRHGEVIYDIKQHKFLALGTSKMHDKTSQTQIVNAFKLSNFVLFEKYGEDK